jgi:hypothetical protein
MIARREEEIQLLFIQPFLFGAPTPFRRRLLFLISFPPRLASPFSRSISHSGDKIQKKRKRKSGSFLLLLLLSLNSVFYFYIEEMDR